MGLWCTTYVLVAIYFTMTRGHRPMVHTGCPPSGRFTYAVIKLLRTGHWPDGRATPWHYGMPICAGMTGGLSPGHNVGGSIALQVRAQPPTDLWPLATGLGFGQASGYDGIERRHTATFGVRAALPSQNHFGRTPPNRRATRRCANQWPDGATRDTMSWFRGPAGGLLGGKDPPAAWVRAGNDLPR
jgi:hypothetical protein